MWILTLASRLSKAALRHGTGVEVTHQRGIAKFTMTHSSAVATKIECLY